MKKEFIVICPHCNDPVLISKIRCGVFRHGSYKNTNKPINAHTNKQKCDELIRNNKIYGCGKPFRLNVIQNENESPTIEVQVCDYI